MLFKLKEKNRKSYKNKKWGQNRAVQLLATLLYTKPNAKNFDWGKSVGGSVSLTITDNFT